MEKKKKPCCFVTSLRLSKSQLEKIKTNTRCPILTDQGIGIQCNYFALYNKT